MHAMLNVAVKAARRASNVIQRASLNLGAVRIESKNHKDFVAEVGCAAKESIIDSILDAYPKHSILAEESSTEGIGSSEYEWIIDPIDGTTNFLHGHPQYAISIALSHKGQVQQAVVFDPNRNDLFTASRGVGAFLNDRRIRVSKRLIMKECVIATGAPRSDQYHIDQYLGMLKALLIKTAGVRREGATSLDLCNVACGRVEGFWQKKPNPFDIAAGGLLVQEAGGIVTDLSGEQRWVETGDVVAASPKVLAQLLHILAPHISK